MSESLDHARLLAAAMLDDELAAIVDNMRDGDTPSLLQSSVIDEIAEREIYME